MINYGFDFLAFLHYMTILISSDHLIRFLLTYNGGLGGLTEFWINAAFPSVFVFNPFTSSGPFYHKSGLVCCQ